MDATELLEKIINLIDLAEKGEIDPWDVQVIEVIDCYLQEMVPVCDTAPASYATDLSQSGQAFLSASMLVLFKANTLVAIASGANEPEPPTDDSFSDDVMRVQSIHPRLPLEQQICRRPAALPPAKRPVTLPELIAQLQLMATQIRSVQAQQVPGTPRTPSPRTATRTQALRALELAHQENLTEVASELEQFLLHRAQQCQQEQDWLNLNQLTEFWTKEKRCGDRTVMPTSAQPQDLVSVFWALLLLSAQSKVELSQDEFYQEIKIRTLSAN